MSAVVAVVAVRAVLVIVGFNVSACILFVRDMYASLDHHMICCPPPPQGRKRMRCHRITFKARRAKSRQASGACVLGRPRVNNSPPESSEEEDLSGSKSPSGFS